MNLVFSIPQALHDGAKRPPFVDADCGCIAHLELVVLDLMPCTVLLLKAIAAITRHSRQLSSFQQFEFTRQQR